MKTILKIIAILFLLFLYSVSYSQFEYNPVDTTFKVGLVELNKIYNEIQTNRFKIEQLNNEISLSENLIDIQGIKIQKLEVRDSISKREIELYKDLERVLTEKIGRFGEITKNYSLLVISKDMELSEKEKQLKKERFWKRTYRIGIPIVSVLTAYLILRK